MGEKRSVVRRDTNRIAPRQVHLPRVLEASERVEGSCARWFTDRCFGWLEVPGVDKDVFVGARQLLNAPDLRRRDKVAFDVAIDGQGRLQAINVVLLDGEPLPAAPPVWESPVVAPWE